MRRGAAVALASAGLPSGAVAHAFDSGADAWGQMLGAGLVPLSDPVLLLGLLPLGLMLGLWQIDGLAQVWPALVAGLVAGAASAPLAGPSISVLAILAGLATALMGAASLSWPFPTVAVAAAGTGLLAGMAMLDGHGPGTVPVPVYLGLLLGALVTVSLSFVLASWTRALVPGPWGRLVGRVASSWLAAIALMLVALGVA